MIVRPDRSLTCSYVTALRKYGLIYNLETTRFAHSSYMPDNSTKKISLNTDQKGSCQNGYHDKLLIVLGLIKSN